MLASLTIFRSSASLFQQLIPTKGLCFLTHETIVYQANPLLGDKISDAPVGQDFYLDAARFLQARVRALQIGIDESWMAHQLGGACGQAAQQLGQAIAREFAGLRDAAKKVGRSDAVMFRLPARVARQQL